MTHERVSTTDDPSSGAVGSEGGPLEGQAGLGSVALRSDPDCTVVALAGEVDMALSADLASVVGEATATGGPIAVDVGDVTFIDSTAIGFIVQLAIAERERGRRLPVRGASRRTADTFRLTGLDEILQVDDPA